MNEQFVNQMYELYMDMIQDARADAKTEEKYYILINAIFNNVTLNWNKQALQINDDEKFSAIIQALEPARYKSEFKSLQEKENPNSDIDEYECGK